MSVWDFSRHSHCPPQWRFRVLKGSSVSILERPVSRFTRSGDLPGQVKPEFLICKLKSQLIQFSSNAPVTLCTPAIAALARSRTPALVLVSLQCLRFTQKMGVRVEEVFDSDPHFRFCRGFSRPILRLRSGQVSLPVSAILGAVYGLKPILQHRLNLIVGQHDRIGLHTAPPGVRNHMI